MSCFSSAYIHPAVIALKITGMKMHNNAELLLHLSSSLWVCLHVWDKNVHFSQLKSCLRNDDVVIEMHLSSAYCLKAHSDKEKWLNWNIMQRIGIASKALKQISPVIIAYEISTQNTMWS